MSDLPSDIEEMLNKIRSSVQRGEMIDELLFREIILKLDTRDVLKVGLKQFRSYLSTYEKYYPEETWILEWLEKAEMFEVTRPVGFYIYPEGVTDIKQSAFIDAVANLDHALRFYLKNSDTTSKNLVFSAISDVVAAKWLTFWMEDDPETWELSRQEEQNEKISKRIWKYRKSSRFKEYEKSSWLSVFDDIEQISYSN